MTWLALYLELERLSLACGEEMADMIRDAMDPVWRKLSVDDRARLDNRGQLFITGQSFTGEVGLRVNDWRTT